MLFKCNPVDLHFFETAPYLYQFQVEIDAPADEVFKVFKDWQTWPKWYKGIRKIEAVGSQLNGLGARRITTMKNGVAADETFYIWEENRRISFYTTGTNIPCARSLAELYELTPLSEEHCRFNYTVGLDPIFPLGLSGQYGKQVAKSVFKDAAKDLATYMKHHYRTETHV